MNRRRFLTLAACAVSANAFAFDHKTGASAADTVFPLPDVWGNGELLAFSGLDGPTDYEAGLVARSAAAPLAVELVWPARLVVGLGEKLTGKTIITSDTFFAETAHGSTRGAFIDAHHLLIEGSCTVGAIPAELAVASRGDCTLIGAKAHFIPGLLDADLSATIQQRQRWLRRQILPSALRQSRRCTLGKAISIMKGQVYTPEGLIRHRWTTPDRWPHRDLWLWDSVFHSIGWRHLDRSLAREMIEAVFDGQQSDGRIPHQLNPARASEITQPPVLAFGIRTLLRDQPDHAWLQTMFPRLERYLEWDFAHRVSSQGGLAQWKIDGNPLSRSGESGMDNSPRFDQAAALDAVDFSAFLSLECEAMAGFAHELGLVDSAHKWTAHHNELNRRLNEFCWDEQAGFYFDYDPARKTRTGIYAASGFLPLLCGAANPQQAARLVTLLQDPQHFGARVPVPSALLTAQTRDPQDMWRGPMWVNMNWLIALGLERNGFAGAALKLRQQTLEEVERRYLALGSLFEFYDETGQRAPDQLPRKGTLGPGSAYHQAVHDYGWTATLYADLAFTTPS